MSVNFTKKAGMSLIEVVIASAIFLLLSLVLVSANANYLRSSMTNLKTVKAIYLAEEGIETISFNANNDWNNLGTVDTVYTLNSSSTDYVRTFYTEEVERDGNDDIVASGGMVDPDTRKLTVEVSWFDRSATTTKSLSTYLMKNND
jgi:prepilin-type N-terminal cleavage/methylation domain-containing protein